MTPTDDSDLYEAQEPAQEPVQRRSAWAFPETPEAETDAEPQPAAPADPAPEAIEPPSPAAAPEPDPEPVTPPPAADPEPVAPSAGVAATDAESPVPPVSADRARKPVLADSPSELALDHPARLPVGARPCRQGV